MTTLLSCSSLVFHPDRERYYTPSDFKLDYQNLYLHSTDDCIVHAWFLRAPGKAKGVVYFLHGNAQNISAHIRSVYWLPARGFHVLALDYRGYGESTGTPSIQGAIEDIDTGFEWLIENPETENLPVFILAQSLGASLAICAADTNPAIRKYATGIVLDAPFSNLRRIAREKLGSCCLTWPLQYPLSMLFSNRCDPEASIRDLAPVPVLIMCSAEDRVIPSSHGKRLFRLSREPKYFIRTRSGHIATFHFEDFRRDLLQFMQTVSDKNASPSK
jgi:hypothetical protein